MTGGITAMGLDEAVVGAVRVGDSDGVEHPAEENAEKQSQTDQASRNITKKNTSAHKIKHRKERKEKKTGGNDSAAAKKAKSQRTLSQDVSKKNTASQLSASTGSYDVTVS